MVTLTNTELRKCLRLMAAGQPLNRTLSSMVGTLNRDELAQELRRREDAPRIAAAKRRRYVEYKQRHCIHDWRWNSHEEQICSKCGLVQFVPDSDNTNWAGPNGQFMDKRGQRA